MGQIQQINPLQNKETIDAGSLQADLNQLFTTINRLDKDNLYAPGGVFDFGSLFLDGLKKIQINLGDSGSENRAVSKEYLEEQLDLNFDPDDGEWHKHDNKAILDDISSAGSGEIITAGERSRIASEDQKDAMDNANSPSSSNAFATMADVSGAGGSQKASIIHVDLASGEYTASVPDLSGTTPRVNHIRILGFINDDSGSTLDRFIETVIVWSSAYCMTRADMTYGWDKITLSGTSYTRIAPTLISGTLHEYQIAKLSDSQFKIKARDNAADSNIDLAIMFYA